MKVFFVLLLILPSISLYLALPTTHVEKTDKKEVLKDAINATCLDGFTALGEKCYQFNAYSISWNDALSTCISIGANLAHISDYDENRLIVEYLLDYYSYSYFFWIGATEIPDEAEWIWSDDNSTIYYTNWGVDQPDNGTGNEYCAGLWRPDNWAWADFDCYDDFGFICQQP